MRDADIRARFAQNAYAAYLGIQLTDIGHERAALYLPYQVAHSNPGGTLNGGATATLLNMAGALAAWTGIDVQPEVFLGTVDLSVQWLAAAVEEDVQATSRVLRRGRDLFFLESAVRSLDDKPICQGLMIYRAPNYAGRPRRTYAKPALLPAPKGSLPPEPPSRLGEFIHKLQVTRTHERPGRVRLTMPCTANHMDEQGHLAEGALAALFDIAGTAASWTLAKHQGSRGATIGMQLSYVHPAHDAVAADAQVQQRSEELFFSTVQITTMTTGQLVAMGNVSYRILEGP